MLSPPRYLVYVQVKGVLDKEEVLFAKNKGYLFGTHVVVGLPECLAEASRAPHAVPIMQHARAVAVDEVDACFQVCLHVLSFLREGHANLLSSNPNRCSWSYIAFHPIILIISCWAHS